MIIATAKKTAKDRGVELYFDRSWKAWGVIDPQMRVESIWLSPASLAQLTKDQFIRCYIQPVTVAISQYELRKRARGGI